MQGPEDEWDVSERDIPDVQFYILQLLAQDLWLVGRDHLELPPGAIARNIGYKDSGYISQQCLKMVKAGLLERDDEQPFYWISDDGLAYVNGEKSLDEITGQVDDEG